MNQDEYFQSSPASLYILNSISYGVNGLVNMNEDYYNSEEWKRIREMRLKHDGYKCRNCGSTTNLQVHHKHYPFQGREDVLDDLITECNVCHRKITQINRNKRKFQPYYTRGNKEESSFWW